MPKPKFPLGALVWTPGAIRAFEAAIPPRSRATVPGRLLPSYCSAMLRVTGAKSEKETAGRMNTPWISICG
jgi:hypothetical protein